MQRDLAEDDISHKQIIPYAIFHYQDRILRYFRGGGSGEKRLAAKGSIGIGGHINDTDFANSSLDRDTYQVGIEREIEEELQIDCNYTQKIIGLINDDSNEVGQVHLGVVHLVTLESEAVSANEDNIEGLSFISFTDLKEQADSLETWSQLCLASLEPYLD